jgi:hypothetical protein
MKRVKASRIYAAVFGGLVALSLVACGGGSTQSANPPATAQPGAAAPADSQGNVTITDVVLKRDDGSGAAGDTVDKFVATDHKQFFEATTSAALGPGSKVRWVFTAVDTTAGKDKKVQEVTLDVLLGNKLTANVSLPNDWPTGKYRADIYINDKLTKSLDYTVDPAS